MRTLITIIFLVISFSGLKAQDKMIPVSEENRITIIYPTMREDLGLFSTYNNFESASLYQRPDNTYYFEVAYKKDGATYKDKLDFTQAQLDDLRAQINELVIKKPGSKNYNHEARLSYLLGTTTLGLFYGNFIPIGAGITSGSAILGSNLLTIGATYLLPYVFTKETDVTKAHRDLSLRLGAVGFAHGFLLQAAFNEYNESMFLTASAVSIFELVYGFRVVNKYKFTLGEARMAANGSLYGLASGWFLAGTIADKIDFEDLNLLTLIPLGGSAAAAYFGPQLARNYNLSGGDAEAVATTTLLGYGLAANFLVHTNDLSVTSFSSVLLLSGIGGYYSGMLLGDNYTISDLNMDYVDLITTGGAIIGGGIAALGSMESEATVHLISAGAFTAFGLSYFNLAKKGNRDLSDNISNRPLELTFNPENAFTNEFDLKNRVRIGKIHRPVFGLTFNIY